MIAYFAFFILTLQYSHSFIRSSPHRVSSKNAFVHSQGDPSPLVTGDIESLQKKLINLCDLYRENEYLTSNVKDLACFKDYSAVETIALIKSITTQLSAFNSSLNTLEDGEMKTKTSCNQNLLNGDWELRFADVDRNFNSAKSYPIRVTQSINVYESRVLHRVEFFNNTGQIKDLEIKYDAKLIDDVFLLKPTFAMLGLKKIFTRRKICLKHFFLRAFRFFKRKYFESSLKIVFIDDDIKITESENKLCIYSRLYDLWDPMIGWTKASLI
jgi:hypothetical protein